MKKETIIRHSFTQNHIKSIHIGNLRYASKMMRLEQQHPKLYQESQEFFYVSCNMSTI